MAVTHATWRRPDPVPANVLVKLWLIRATVLALTAPFIAFLANSSKSPVVSFVELLVAFGAILAASLMGRGSYRLPLAVLNGQVKQPGKGKIAESFPVWVEWKRGTVIAVDDGLLSFRGGILSFEGRRTNFRFGRGNAEQALWWQTSDLRSPLAIVFVGEIELRIFPAFPWRMKKRLRENLRSQFGNWIPADPVQNEVLPPTTPDAAYATAQVRLAWWLFAFGLLIPSLIFALLWTRVAVPHYFVMPTVFCGIWLLFCAAPASVRASNAHLLLASAR